MTRSVLLMSPISGEDWGGVEKWMLLLGAHLRVRGHRVSVAGRPGARWLESGLGAGFDGLALPFRSDFHVDDMRPLRRFFASREVDLCVVKTHGTVRLVWATRLPGLRRPAIVCRLGDARVKRGLRSFLTHRLLVDRFITPSRSVRDQVVATGYVRAERVAVVPNGVRVPAPDRGARERARRELALGDGPVLIVTSRLHESKGHAHLLAAFEPIAAGHPSAALVVVGDGKLRGALEEDARRRGIAGRVRFTGLRSDVEDLLPAADLFVLPSLLEGLPNAVLEAMASGLPVVATDVDGVGEAVIDGVTGTLVPPADSGALGAAIEDLLADPARRRSLGAAGRARVREHFTLEGALRASEASCLEATRPRRSPWRPASS